MVHGLDVATLAICFGICSLSQLLAFYLQYRISRSVNGPGWWATGSFCLVVGFLTFFIRAVDSIHQAAVLVYGMSFILNFSFIYIGITKFKSIPTRWRTIIAIDMVAFISLLSTFLYNDTIPLRRTFLSIFCSLLLLLSIHALTRKPGLRSDLASRFLVLLFFFNALFFLVLSFGPVLSKHEVLFFEKPNPLILTYLLIITINPLSTFGLIILVNEKLSEQLKTSKVFLESTLDGLSANIALMEENGEIILVNKAWKNFARANGIDPARVSEGMNYIKICENGSTDCSGDAFIFSEGLKSVLNGKQKLFTMEYACHSFKEKRWFLGRITPFPGNGPKRVVIAHEDITERKLIEIALQESNIKLEMITNEDGLTKISNRRHFDRLLATECARHARSGFTLSVIMIDIDYFKNYNDTYGHVKGDECLKNVAQAISRSLKRETDIAARYGGEEFICLLPETNVIGAAIVAEDIRSTIESKAFPHETSLVSKVVTVSVGAVSLKCQPEMKPDDVVRQVDELLYQAKSEGRNRVIFRGVNEDTYVERTQHTDMVLKVVWDKSWLSGNASLDQQHMHLVDIANAILQCVFSETEKTDLKSHISDLISHAETHFRDEENILRAVGYPEIEAHTAEHNRLLQKCSSLLAKKNVYGISTADILQCIVHDLVMQHMLHEDAKYHPFSSCCES